ncbi:MAG: RNA polymerase subunit sigma-70 [Planctomycetota bacterium]|nr:MAG: RNA polymerase subunit sigma-70 [Planctomycetota bacterium]
MAETESSERDLLQRAAAGDSRAVAELLERYRGRLRRMVAIRLDKRVAARMDASDIVQDALSSAVARLPQYLADPQLPFYPWLRRIAWDRLLRVHRDHIDADKRSVLKEHAWRPDLNDQSMSELVLQLAQDSLDPSQKAMEAETQSRVRTALGMLKPADREILAMRHLERMSVEEIAIELCITPTAVTSRHFRALVRLRKLMGDSGKGLS